jgi:hypothetical protein
MIMNMKFDLPTLQIYCIHFLWRHLCLLYDPYRAYRLNLDRENLERRQQLLPRVANKVESYKFAKHEITQKSFKIS